MKVQTLEERVQRAAENTSIIMDMASGLTKVGPSVMMFYGVKRTPTLVITGQGRQRRFLALIGEHIIIENYEGKTII